MAQSQSVIAYHRDTVQPLKVKAIPVSLHTSKEPMADSSTAQLHTILTFQAQGRQLPSRLAVTQATGPTSGTWLRARVLAWPKLGRMAVGALCPLSSAVITAEP